MRALVFLLQAALMAGSFGAGPGAWPMHGAIYEVSPEYFPNHSLAEITAQLPRLKQLGISVLYVTPIWKCKDKAQYWILDYYAINPRYGSDGDLHQLIQTAHANNIRVLLDLETSLTIEGSGIFNDHPGWILRGKSGEMQRYYPIPIFGWALDSTNPEVIDYFTKVARYYVEKFDIDGWRIDSPTDNYDKTKVAGDHTRTDLLRSVRRAITAVKPDALMIAEVAGPTVLFGAPGESKAPLFDEMCEASYNYLYCGFSGGNDKSGYSYIVLDGAPPAWKIQPAMLNRVVHNEVTSREFVQSVLHQPILYNRLRANFIENHDTERVSKAFPKQHRALLVLIATMPGVPVVHAGQEIGSTKHPDASGNTDVLVDWAGGDRNLEEFYGAILRARANNPALMKGGVRDAWKSGDRALAYIRQEGKSRVLTALNFGDKPARITVTLGGKTLVDLLDGKQQAIKVSKSGELALTLEPYAYRLLKIQ